MLVPCQKKNISQNLTIIVKPSKPLVKSIDLHEWPTVIQTRAWGAWATEVYAHQGYIGELLEFLRFPVHAGLPP